MVYSDLFRFRLYGSRDEYTRVTGKECPPYDPTRKIKRWEDPALGKANRKYRVWRDGELQDLLMSGEEAQRVNLPHLLPNEVTVGEHETPLMPVPRGWTLRQGMMGAELISAEQLSSGPATRADVERIEKALAAILKAVKGSKK